MSSITMSSIIVLPSVTWKLCNQSINTVLECQVVTHAGTGAYFKIDSLAVEKELLPIDNLGGR